MLVYPEKGPGLLKLLYSREIGSVTNLSHRVTYEKNLKAMLWKNKRDSDANSFPYEDYTFVGFSPDGKFVFATHRPNLQALIHSIDGDPFGHSIQSVCEAAVFAVTPQYLIPAVSISVEIHEDHTGPGFSMTHVKFLPADSTKAIIFKVPTENYVRSMHPLEKRFRTLTIPLHYLDFTDNLHVRCAMSMAISQAKVAGFQETTSKQFVVIDDGFVANRTFVISCLRIIKKIQEPMVIDKLSSQSGLRVWKIVRGPHCSTASTAGLLSPDAAINDCFVSNVESFAFEDETSDSSIDTELLSPSPECFYLLETCLDVEKCIEQFAVRKIGSMEGQSTKYLGYGQYDVNIISASSEAVRLAVTAIVEASRDGQNVMYALSFNVKWSADGSTFCRFLKISPVRSSQALREDYLTDLICRQSGRLRKAAPEQVGFCSHGTDFDNVPYIESNGLRLRF
ncbi:hypothetical protein QR680_013782 [Steinernema hermaphroditum]|uniref:Uncharacterized protein n=1 Tax=Steinernema hermaphroditum TaxID=289476 RepID=A0AA39M2Y2_9BILA|nr:hypothetical protein QR680_013782 [Steinernema hermaphroditum]